MQKSANLSERLVLRRNRLNLTQQMLADKSKVSPRSITDYETGLAQPTMRNLEKLAEALEVSPAWLMGSEDWEAGERGPGYGTGGLDLKKLPQRSLEDLFVSLGQELKQATGADRSGIMKSLDAVHEELRRREEPRPKLEGKGLSSDVKEIALGSVDIASHMARQAAGREGQQKNRAASPSDKKHGPSGDVPPPKGSGSEDR